MKIVITLASILFLGGCTSLPGSADQAHRVVEKVQDALVGEAEDRLCKRLTVGQYRLRYNTKDLAKAYWDYCELIQKRWTRSQAPPIN